MKSAGGGRSYVLSIAFETAEDLTTFVQTNLAEGIAAFDADALDPEVRRTASRTYVIRNADERRIVPAVATGAVPRKPA